MFSLTADLLGDGGLRLLAFVSLMDKLGRLESEEPLGGNFSEMDERREWAVCTEERRPDMV